MEHFLGMGPVECQVLRVMNSVDHMINNVRYVYPGPVCPSNEKLIAYVFLGFPKGAAL